MLLRNRIKSGCLQAAILLHVSLSRVGRRPFITSQVGQKDTKSVGKPLLKLHDDLDDEFRLKVSTDCKLPEFFRLGFQLLFPEPRSNTQPHKNRSRYATALAYAYVHYVPVDLLVGFIDMAGGYDIAHEKYYAGHRELRISSGALPEAVSNVSIS